MIYKGEILPYFDFNISGAAKSERGNSTKQIKAGEKRVVSTKMGLSLLNEGKVFTYPYKIETNGAEHPDVFYVDASFEYPAGVYENIWGRPSAKLVPMTMDFYTWDDYDGWIQEEFSQTIMLRAYRQFKSYEDWLTSYKKSNLKRVDYSDMSKDRVISMCPIYKSMICPSCLKASKHMYMAYDRKNLGFRCRACCEPEFTQHLKHAQKETEALEKALARADKKAAAKKSL